MAKATRRYSETIQVCRPVIVRDETGGAASESHEVLQTVLAAVRDDVRARVDNISTALQLNNAIAFTFYKSESYEVTPDLFIIWRNKRMVLQYFKQPEVKKIEIVCVYGTV